jgi:phospholipid-binding lipoprotein MlaA
MDTAPHNKMRGGQEYAKIIYMLVLGGERRVNPVKKLWSVAAVIFFLVIFLSYNPAVAFNDEATLYLAQATPEDANKRPKTSRDDILDQAKEEQGPEEDEYDDEDEYGDAEDVELIPDPWIEMNQGLYTFNDRLYFWLLKPVSRGYGFIIPEELRQGVRNFMYNIRFPVRFINALLQGKVRKSGYEFGQFFINSTAGCLGLLNPSANYPHLQPSKEDMGQTFAVWGIGNGAYIMLPFLGPSSLRDGMGRIGDTFLDPLWWLFDDIWVTLAIRAGEAVNDTSLRIGEYEALKDAALDPYVMIRNAYIQNRNKLIAE